MKFLLALLAGFPLLAQQAAQPTPDASASSPTPTGAEWFTGSIDLGYRFTSIGGDNDVYRSVVNLGQGPRLLGLDFTIADPKKRLFDRLNVRAYNWGGDPYNTVHVDASKQGIYDFNFEYRDLAYFNLLPSFADPLLGTGVVLDEDSYFARRRMSDFNLDLLPGHHVIPFLAYGRDSGEGTGISTFYSDINQYPIADHTFDKTDNYRGGVRLEFNRFHVTLEQGGTTLREDQDAYNSTTNYGNNLQPYFGQNLYLSSLDQAYGISGSSIYTKALFTANPVPWLDVSGQFLYSEPKTNVNYTQFDTGNLVLQSAILFYTGEQALGFAAGKQPHTTGNIGFQLRPFKRVRILESWMTDRMHTSAAGLFTDMILQPVSSADTILTPLSSLLALNYNQEQVDILVDVTRKLTLHGGYRYTWGDAQTGDALVAGPGQESSEMRQQTGIGGANFRATQKLSANVDFEGTASDHAYFRTSLYNYQRMRARARYQVNNALSLQAVFTLLRNENPLTGINYSFLSRQNSLSASWTPSKKITVLGEYTRSTLRSDIGYLEPEFLSPETSLYRDNAHSATSLVDVALPGYAKLTPRLAFGGSLFISSGSRPTTFYQPMVRLTVPLYKNIAWKSEYRYYGYGELFYLYEGFRAHLLQTGLTISR
ncbi:MAG TPA: hypothetical protein VMT86_17605 [Bryobacteraceae bacterium]|nr:hypothetical protein [Bryobacteraceae bacterium]